MAPSVRSLTECERDTDCRLRVAGCCECGATITAENLIAIRTDAETGFSALVCDPAQGCTDCAPIYPSQFSAYCVTDGHCAVR
jgi:hypothetical protein